MIQHSEEVLRDAISRLARAAWDDDAQLIFSVPPNPEQDVDLILDAAIDELIALRAKVATIEVNTKSIPELTSNIASLCTTLASYGFEQSAVIEAAKALVRNEDLKTLVNVGNKANLEAAVSEFTVTWNKAMSEFKQIFSNGKGK